MTNPSGLPDDMAALTSSTSRRVFFECHRYHPSKLSSSIQSSSCLLPAETSMISILSWAVIGGTLSPHCARVSSPCHFPPHPMSLPSLVLRSVSLMGSRFRRLASLHRLQSSSLRVSFWQATLNVS